MVKSHHVQPKDFEEGIFRNVKLVAHYVLT